MARRRPVGRRLVLDNQAASALLRGPRTERRQVLEALAAADGGTIVPCAIRVEAGWDRRTGVAASANRLVPDDAALDRNDADRAAELRAVVAAASVVEACVAVAAERAAVRGGSSGDSHLGPRRHGGPCRAPPGTRRGAPALTNLAPKWTVRRA